jgi:hypothetical protein
MARARNIKPAFFADDELAELEPICRLFFVGLWTIADFKGDLEWRPKRIKAQILPYDNADIEQLAINLDKSRFVTFYSVSGKTYLRINNFAKHQNPHPNEKKKGSEIPEYEEEHRQAIDSKEVAIDHDKSRLKRNDSTSDRADSLLLIPDSCSPIKNIDQPAAPPDRQVYTKEFSHFWSHFPPHFGAKGSKARAFDQFKKHKPDPSLITKMITEVSRQADEKQALADRNEFYENFPHVERWIKNRRWEDDEQSPPIVNQHKSPMKTLTDTAWADGFVQLDHMPEDSPCQ